MATETESTPNLKQQLKAAITEARRTDNVAMAVDSLKACNTFLTGQNQGDFIPEKETDLTRKVLEALENAKRDGEANSEPIYLGDGGYSRLVFRIDGEEVMAGLTSNSTERAKELWKGLEE